MGKKYEKGEKMGGRKMDLGIVVIQEISEAIFLRTGRGKYTTLLHKRGIGDDIRVWTTGECTSKASGKTCVCGRVRVTHTSKHATLDYPRP